MSLNCYIDMVVASGALTMVVTRDNSVVHITRSDVNIKFKMFNVHDIILPFRVEFIFQNKKKNDLVA